MWPTLAGPRVSSEYFGEMCLLSSKAFGAKAFAMDRRTCTITAHTLVDVMVLDKSDLEGVVQDYPILLTQMLDVATKRLEELGEAARITSFNKAAGCAITTALNTKRWLKRASARVTPAGGNRSSRDSSAEGDAPATGHTSRISMPSAVEEASGGAPATAEQVAKLTQMVQALQSEVSALRKEVRGP